jgi:hypothetical protein
MDVDIRNDIDEFANNIGDAMGVIEIIRQEVCGAKNEVEIVAWKSLTDVGLTQCVEELDKVAMGLHRLCKSQEESEE